jgi:hypothetical protein
MGELRAMPPEEGLRTGRMRRLGGFFGFSPGISGLARS